MAKRSSALESNYHQIHNTNEDKNSLVLREIKDLQLIQIAAWPETIEKVGKDIARYLNLPTYPLANKALTHQDSIIMRVEPLKWWLIGSQTPLLSTQDGTTLDLSHSYTRIEISGNNSQLFLNRFLPLDLRDNFFPSGSVASSTIHHVSIKLLRLEKSFQIFIPRGFALSLWETFLETAKQFNFEVK